MAFKKYSVLALALVISLFLDTAVLPKWNLFSMIPFLMLALTLASQQVFSMQTAMVIGALGGLAEDLLCENMIGLTPALLLLATMAYKKLPKDSDTKPIILGSYFGFLTFGVELLRACASWIIGMRFGFLNAILYGMLPRALLTGLWGLLYMSLFKPLLRRQVDAV